VSWAGCLSCDAAAGVVRCKLLGGDVTATCEIGSERIRGLCGGRGEAIRDIGAEGFANRDDRKRRDENDDGEVQEGPHGPAVLMPRGSIEPQPHHWNIRTVAGR
jgi:hypothetical protein